MLPEFDTSRFYLGVLCHKRHDWERTGQSLRYHSTTRCLACTKEHYQRVTEPDKREKQGLKQRSQELLLAHNINTQLHYLGKLCKRSHDWNESGRSLRFASGGACVLCRREHEKVRYHQNREQERERGRLKRLRHPRDHKAEYWRNRERERLRKARHYVTHKSTYRERARKWYLKNRDHVLEQSRRYQSTPNGRLVRKKISAKRIAAILNSRSVPYSLSELRQHFAKFDFRCAYCGTSERITIDHFIPLSKGGDDCLGNFVPACLSCNCSKNASDAFEWYQRQEFYDRKRWTKILKVLGKDNPNQLPLF